MPNSERLNHWLRSIDTTFDIIESPPSRPSSYDRDCESDSDLENLNDKHRHLCRKHSDADSPKSIFSAGDAVHYAFYRSDRSMSGTYHTAGQGDGEGYKRQLEANGVEEIALVNHPDPELEEYQLVFKPSYFSVQVSLARSRQI